MSAAGHHVDGVRGVRAGGQVDRVLTLPDAQEFELVEERPSSRLAKRRRPSLPVEAG
ncbi:MAG: hypothetical protein VXW31_01660 [Planctomycetota bacterium]|nr:hypothetical protein [Planctomycetota bacterium]